MICVSKRQPAGNSGRVGRSIIRLVSTSFSAGLPSRLKKPPGMRPGRVGVFAVVDGQRQEVDAFTRIRRVAGGDQDHRVAEANDDRAVGLLGELAGFETKGVLSDGDFARMHSCSSEF